MDPSVAPTTPPRSPGPTPLGDVLVTDALARRPARAPDHAAENAALRELLRETASAPAAVPTSTQAVVARLARALCGAESAGLSLLERDGQGRVVLRWAALAGRLASQEGATAPRDWSPEGTCLDLGAPQLLDRPARHFPYLEAAGITEALVVPFAAPEAGYPDGPLGALWVVAHDDGRRFDAEDARLLESLTGVAAGVIARARAHDLARQALSAHDRFLSIVSHDLRNMLSIVLMNSAMLSRQATALGAGDLLRWADKTRRAADQMSRLVNDLLDSAALEAGRLQLDPARLDPTTLLRDVATSLEAIATAQRVAIHVAADPAPGPAVSADPGRMRQVLENLLTNALKFSPPGGRVTLDAAVEGQQVVLSVSDEGPGVDPADVPRLFQRFASGDRKRSGHGLGLWIARQLVEEHGGRIWVEARAGPGSVFRVALPRLEDRPHPT